ncbi:MAG: type VI secretion system baseplate subunit TssE [Phycisphaeraceae bacterium]|nr:type VI secretion system baseplate subunit TssE [Phycisphaerales bacterium]QOJ18264.1 MAG: type VI secretion system baseplate subunit TssE [Phycisphaeraceae bacterium]
MPELIPKELLQPSLLDRLTDDEPDKQVESRDKRVLSMRRLREVVLRDLEWLLNTSNWDGQGVLDDYPQVQSSVLNFGLRDMTGGTASGLDVADVEKRVREAILRFEPRILPPSLRVKAIISEDHGAPNVLSLEITGDLWAEPVPENLYLQTRVDLESGSILLDESIGRGSR